MKLATELGWVIVLKVAAIILIWWLFFSDPPSVDPARHVLPPGA